MISFEFASMDFSRPGKNRFQYKLTGFDHDWIQGGNNHSATYTNLNPGTYTFNVKGSNSDGVWNEQPTIMLLTILPPWYMTWWFRILVGIIIVAALYGIYRYRLRQALKLQVIRDRIASDLHDEIGSNLSNISIFSTVGKSKLNDTAEVSSLFTLIKDYTQTSMEAMSDIVWMINSKNDRFENIIVRMRTHAADVFEAKDCDLHLSFDEKLNDQKLGMDERKNFFLIYKEAINNIAKYAECKNVWIEMKKNHTAFHLTIKDDGKGFDMNQQQHGNGLINMQKRAEVLRGAFQIISSPGNGTVLNLQFKV
jgi:signal transduction histidine kinase